MPAFNTRSTASLAQYLAAQTGTLVSSDVAWASGAQVAPAFGTTVALDFATGINFALTATSNFTLANPVNVKAGQTGRIKITQDSTGSRTINYGSTWRKAASDTSALSTGAGAIDLIYYDVLDATTIVFTIRRAIG